VLIRWRTVRSLTKTVFEPGREIPVFAETDVLVVGGGPAGTAAAIAAAGVGADVLLVERYNHLGGLSTGGLVIWIDRMQPVAFTKDSAPGGPATIPIEGQQRRGW
jgi:flavin-dependent dehydrogenase